MMKNTRDASKKKWNEGYIKDYFLFGCPKMHWFKGIMLGVTFCWGDMTFLNHRLSPCHCILRPAFWLLLSFVLSKTLKTKIAPTCFFLMLLVWDFCTLRLHTHISLEIFCGKFYLGPMRLIQKRNMIEVRVYMRENQR